VFEMLEQRRLLSGNVTAVSVDGALVITGDKQSNQINVRGDASIGYIVNGAPGSGTTVNGSLDPQVIASGSEATDAKISLRAGDDVIGMSHIGFYEFALSTGSGNDVVNLGSNSEIFNTRDSTIDTGTGDDSVTIRSNDTQGTLAIFTGNGNDVVDLANVHPAFLYIDAGKRDDTVRFGGTVSVTNTATVDGGRGLDALLGIESLSAGSRSILGFNS
jgi:hypothetical protein